MNPRLVRTHILCITVRVLTVAFMCDRSGTAAMDVQTPSLNGDKQCLGGVPSLLSAHTPEEALDG